MAGDSEMQGEVGFSVNVFFLADMLAGPSEVHIRASVPAVVPVIEECVHKVCSATVSFALMKDAICIG